MSGGSETYYLLHRLWTKAVGTPGYVKKDWQALEAALLTFERTSGRPTAIPDDASPRPTAWERLLRD